MEVIKRLRIERKKNGKTQGVYLFLCPFCYKKVTRTIGEGKRAKSCGCAKELLTGFNSKTHGGSKTRLYRTWRHMKERCYRHNDNRFNRYGGRGIKVCDEWKDNFETFRNWALKNGYTDELTLDREDVDKNYTPENCQFISYSKNSRKDGYLKKLSWEDVENIRKEYKEQNISYTKLGEKYGIKKLTYVLLF